MRWMGWSWLAVCGLSCVASGQASGSGSPAKAANYSGCVSKVPETESSYVLAAGGKCLLLRGTYKAEDLLGKDVVLRGVVASAMGHLPMTLKVESTVAVKASCSRTCTPEPPGSRGLNGDEKPGREGGTPGVDDSQPK